ncbi:MAG: helix-turn-helix domain-containing protein [Bacteroidota bacterium]
MNTLEILQHYRPLQPSVKFGDTNIVYEEVKPSTALAPFIFCFWQLKTTKPLPEPFQYRVVSDGCIDIFFNHKKPEENFVMGFCRKYTEFAIGHEFDYIGIRFLPAIFPLLFGIDAKSLSNVSPPLQEVLPQFSEWITNHLLPDHSFPFIVKGLNEKMGNQLANPNLNLDPRFFNALGKIFKRKGYLDIEKELETGLSPRQLRRIFNFYIGTTPKAFSNVVRFQHILNAKPSQESLKENKLYYDVGFFDQAHFIKNFKTFYGITPSEAFR